MNNWNSVNDTDRIFFSYLKEVYKRIFHTENNKALFCGEGLLISWVHRGIIRCTETQSYLKSMIIQVPGVAVNGITHWGEAMLIMVKVHFTVSQFVSEMDNDSV